MGRDAGDAAADDGDGDVPVHEVIRALATIRRVTQGAGSARTWSLSDGELRSALLDAQAAGAGVEALRLGLVRDLDARPEAVPGVAPGRTAVTFLVHACRVSPGQAHRDVAAAHALNPDTGVLPEMGAALAAGEVSRAHVDVAVRTLARIPAHLCRAVGEEGVSGAARVDGFLTEQSRVLAPASTDRLARQLLATLDPSGSDRYDPHAYQRRGLACAVDSTGMLVGRFQLDPAAAAVVKAALDAHAAPTPHTTGEDQDGQGVLVADERTRPQRYADALTAIARHALSAAPSSAGEPAHVLVVATPEQVAAAQRAVAQGSAGGQNTAAAAGSAEREPPAAGLAWCAQTGPVDPGTLGRLGCDAILTRVLLAPSGAVLDLGRSVRTASPAQRRALAARDGGCVIPGCTAPPGICEAHHVSWFRHGGGTDITNLALVCPRHHSSVHAGGTWTLRMIDGLPWARPPTWIDPQRRLLRNTAHQAAEQARRLGHQLRLNLDHDSKGTGDTGDVGDVGDICGEDGKGGDADGTDRRKSA